MISSRSALIAFILAALAPLACASTPPPNHYRLALTDEEACCGSLRDPAARSGCVAAIPRAQGDETSALNQETFACVHRHFRCDPATGHATRESAQLQLDCLNDLESTKSAPPPSS